MVKNLPCNAGDMGSILGLGTKIPHAAEQLSLLVVTTESRSSRAHATRESVHHKERSHMKEERSQEPQLRAKETK